MYVGHKNSGHKFMLDDIESDEKSDHLIDEITDLTLTIITPKIM